MKYISRCFIDVGGRIVHYRRAGSGPPLVMLHGSPGDSQMLCEEIAFCATSFTVFALDTAGFGYSDALPGDTLTLRDLAAAAAETMRALGLPPCPVYGSHTGACIAIELGIGWPEQITGLVMEGLPIFTQAEMDEIFRGYFAPMNPEPLGGHLITTWMRFRDQFTWFPWPSRNVARLNAIDRPDPASIDLWVSMFYRSCKTYFPAYRAACFYGQAAFRAAEALTLPAIYMATVEDMLHPHLDRLPALKRGQRIAPLPSTQNERLATALAYVSEFAGTAPAPAHRQMAVGQASRKRYIDGPHGQSFIRLYGDASHPACILLHDSPGTSLTLHETALALAGTHYVIVPDLPGCGLSDAPEIQDILAAAAAQILAIAETLGVAQFTVAAAGTGSAVAASLAARQDPRITKILAQAIPAGLVAPEIPLSPTGAHWVQAWLMLRDTQIYHPWYAGTVAAQRKTQGNFDAAWLHDQTVALMEGRATCHLLPQAAATCAAITATLPDDAFTPENLPKYLN